mgnify:CR=1 FL=1
MWIVDELKKYDWLHAHMETTALFPFLDNSGIMFMSYNISDVIQTCIRKIFDRDEFLSMISACKACKVMVQIENNNANHNARLPVTVGTSASDVFHSMEDEVIDVDANIAGMPKFDVLIAIPLVTFRCDEKQTIILAILNRDIVWRAISLSEKYMKMKRDKEDKSRIHLKLHTREFLFTMDNPRLLNKSAEYNMSRFLSKIFPFPDDVNAIIAEKVCRAVSRINRHSFMTFGRGLVNYSTCRLIRIGSCDTKNTRRMCSLYRYYTMTHAEREDEFVNVRRIYTYKGRIFARKVCYKNTRSGRPY